MCTDRIYSINVFTHSFSLQTTELCKLYVSAASNEFTFQPHNTSKEGTEIYYSTFPLPKQILVTVKTLLDFSWWQAFTAKRILPDWRTQVTSNSQYVLHVDEIFRFCLKYLTGIFYLYCFMLFYIMHGLLGYKEFLIIISSTGRLSEKGLIWNVFFFPFFYICTWKLSQTKNNSEICYKNCLHVKRLFFLY